MSFSCKPTLAQLVERRTVGFADKSLGRWFESGMSDVILLLFLSLIFFLIRLRDASAGTKGNNQATAKKIKLAKESKDSQRSSHLSYETDKKKQGQEFCSASVTYLWLQCDDKDSRAGHSVGTGSVARFLRNFGS